MRKEAGIIEKAALQIRTAGKPVDREGRDFDDSEIDRIVDTCHLRWQAKELDGRYKDEPAFCTNADLIYRTLGRIPGDPQ